MDVNTRVLSKRSIRVLYSVADAILASQGRSLDRDIAPAFKRRLLHDGVAMARWSWCMLACIEWLPVITFRSRRVFSQLDVDRRSSILRSWEMSRLGFRRRALLTLRKLIEGVLQET